MTMTIVWFDRTLPIRLGAEQGQLPCGLTGSVQRFFSLFDPLLATVKRRKLTWFWHVTRYDSLSKSVLQGTLEGGDVVVGRGYAV